MKNQKTKVMIPVYVTREAKQTTTVYVAVDKSEPGWKKKALDEAIHETQFGYPSEDWKMVSSGMYEGVVGGAL